MIEVRARSRPIISQAARTPYGYLVIGGPRSPERLPEGAVWPRGTYHTLTGRAINVWPWRTGDTIIGLIYHEYHPTKDSGFQFIATHIYELHDKTWRYMGKASSWQDACDRLDAQHRKRHSLTSLQPVAARARNRPNLIVLS